MNAPTTTSVIIFQTIHWLDLHSALTLHLATLLGSLLVPHLHELRAREVIIVARAIAFCQVPGHLWLSQECSVGAAAVEGHNVAQTAPLAAMSCVEEPVLDLWRERLAEICLESLRRHEHYLEASWQTLLPFKLLCQEIDLGTFLPLGGGLPVDAQVYYSQSRIVSHHGLTLLQRHLRPLAKSHLCFKSHVWIWP